MPVLLSIVSADVIIVIITHFVFIYFPFLMHSEFLPVIDYPN
jgi:hypothetical protein